MDRVYKAVRFHCTGIGIYSKVLLVGEYSADTGKGKTHISLT